MKIDKEMFLRKMFDDLDSIMNFCDANLEGGWHKKELYQIHQLIFKELQKCYKETSLNNQQLKAV